MEKDGVLAKLPKKLKNEPLVDAVFEVRFEGSDQIAVADVLPGSLYKELLGEITLARLPIADVPKPIRDNNPNLCYLPIVRLDWKQLGIAIGDRSLVISCKLPYIGWDNFKPQILDIIESVKQTEVIGQIERFSVKYVNLIQAPDISEQVKKIHMEISIGDNTINNESISLRIEQREDEILHILQIITGAQGILDQKNISGVVVDIDSIREIGNLDFPKFTESLPESLETLKQSNKRKFFTCLTEGAIQDMLPI